MFFKGTIYSKGNGLGLYIVQKSIDTLNGKITLESRPGKFTNFIVNIPIDNQPLRDVLTAEQAEGMLVFEH